MTTKSTVKSRSGKVGRTAAGIALLTGIGVVGVTAPAEAASCSGASCEGKDPQSYGCSSDAKTIAEFTDVERFEMRYSAKCAAVWTRVDSDTDYNTVFMQIRSYYLGDKKRKKVYGAQVLKGTHWTKMMNYNGQWLKSCESLSWFDADPDECTGYK